MVKFNGSSGCVAPGGASSNHHMNGHVSLSTNGMGGASGAGLSSSFNGHMTTANGLNSLGLDGGQESAHISLSHSFSRPRINATTTSASPAQHGIIPSSSFTSGNIHNPPQSAGPLGSHHLVPIGGGQGSATNLGDFDDEISDIFHGLCYCDPLIAYDRSRPGADLSNTPGSNRATAMQPDGYGLWGVFGGSNIHLPVLLDSDDSDEFSLPQQQTKPAPQQSSVFTGGPSSGTWDSGGSAIQSQNIWGGVVFSSRPTGPFQSVAGVSSVAPQTQLPSQVTHVIQHQQSGSRTSSYSGSNSDQSRFNSPTGTSRFGGFSPINGGIETSYGGLLTTFSLGEERESRSPFKVGVYHLGHYGTIN